jgi:hypothetical protein
MQRGLNRAYKIPLKEFTNLAKTIAGSTIAVPSHIADLAQRAIVSRERCAAWFGTRTGVDSARNFGHSHFIEVLEETLALLGISGGETCA